MLSKIVQNDLSLASGSNTEHTCTKIIVQV